MVSTEAPRAASTADNPGTSCQLSTSFPSHGPDQRRQLSRISSLAERYRLHGILSTRPANCFPSCMSRVRFPSPSTLPTKLPVRAKIGQAPSKRRWRGLAFSSASGGADSPRAGTVLARRGSSASSGSDMLVRKLALAAIAAVLLAFGPALAQDKVVKIDNWSDYIDPQVLKDFTAKTGMKVVYDVYDKRRLGNQAARRQYRLRPRGAARPISSPARSRPASSRRSTNPRSRTGRTWTRTSWRRPPSTIPTTPTR